MVEPGTPTARGRHRDERAHRAILDAAATLVEDNGYAAVTIEGVAATAGVGKTTIYRWWPSKAHLVLEVLVDRWYEVGDDPNTGSSRQDLIEYLSVNHRNQTGIAGQVMPQLVIDLKGTAEVGEALRSGFIERRLAIGTTILQRAVDRGDLPADTDVELLLDIAAGVPMAQQLKSGAIRDLRDVEAIVDLLLSGRTPRCRPD